MNRRAWLTAVVAAPLAALVTPMLERPTRWRWVSLGNSYVEGWRTGRGYWVPARAPHVVNFRIFADDPLWSRLRGECHVERGRLVA